MEDGEGREEGEREKIKMEPLEDGEMYEEEGEICVVVVRDVFGGSPCPPHIN